MHNVVFCLMGPTASGKTDIACELAESLPLEIVSVDSVMIYREMDIGSAKPEPCVLMRAPHALVDIIDPTESYSAANFCDDAKRLCRDILSRGNYPLLVGGTMMYFNALQQGMASLPEADLKIRNMILEKANKLGWEHMHSELKQVDPVAAKRIHPNDRQRTQRALEVYQIKKVPLSYLLAEQQIDNEFNYINYSLMPEDRAWLHQRISLRFLKMIDAGFIEEVEALQSKWNLTSDYPSMRCVGYRQALEYLSGAYDLDAFRDKGTAATRQLAKRQLTWLRNWPEVNVLKAEDQNIKNTIIDNIQQILDNVNNKFI